MILWRSKSQHETRPLILKVPRAWRWIFEIANYGIGFQEQVRFSEYDDWRDGVRYYMIYLTWHFYLGFRHVYYDGAHCSFTLGFIQFSWTGDRNGYCSKCMY